MDDLAISVRKLDVILNGKKTNRQGSRLPITSRLPMMYFAFLFLDASHSLVSTLWPFVTWVDKSSLLVNIRETHNISDAKQTRYDNRKNFKQNAHSRI